MKLRYLALIGLTLITFVSQDIWVTYSPILTNVSSLTGTSVSYLGFLAISYPVLFLILTIPSGILLDRNFKLWLSFGAIITMVGGVFRILSPSNYLWLFFFQLLGGIGQPFLLNAFAPFASKYYEKNKPLIISILSFSMYLGTIYSLAVGTYLYKLGGLYLVFLPTSIMAIFGIVLYLFGIKSIENKRSIENIKLLNEMKYAIKQKNLWLLGIVLGLGVATFDNISTWLQPVLNTVGMGNISGTVVAFTMIIGLIGIMIFPNIVAMKNLRTIYLRIIVILIFLFFISLAFEISRTALYVLLPISGFLMLPAYPIIMEWISKFYDKSRQGIASGFMALVSRVFSVIFTVFAVFVIMNVTSYFVYLAILILGASIFTFLLPKDKGISVL
jgi:major facilitator 4 family protein